jgi:16S rRNA (cytosine1402-N4)-methyltransferase
LDEHRPVLVEEVLEALAVQPAGFYVDATFGRGGHSARILQQLGPQGRLLACDRDSDAIAAGRKRFGSEPRLVLVHGEFSALAQHVRMVREGRGCDGVLFDFGVSSPQLDDARRGFSFLHDGPLDMRMDPTHGQPASAWLATASVAEMRDVIATLGEERYARRIAEAIGRARVTQPLRRTTELAEVVSRAVPTREPGKHPATRTFQALRMQVNDELGQIRAGLDQALEVLVPNGRLAAISFHSLEDRLVKEFIRRHSQPDPALARLPVLPTQLKLPLRRLPKRKPTAAEIAANPRARSAMLRAAEKRA